VSQIGARNNSCTSETFMCFYVHYIMYFEFYVHIKDELI
jgi:hypothetical protein